jgi:hypothetical protein
MLDRIPPHELIISIRVDEIPADDPRFDGFKCACITGLAGLNWTAQEGDQGSRSWPRTYAWYTFWMPAEEFNEAFVARYRTRVAEELSRQGLAIHWRLGCIEPDGTLRYVATVDY